MFIACGAFQTEAGGERIGPLLVFNPAGTFHGDHFLSSGAFFSISVPSLADDISCEMRLPSAPTCIESRAAVMTAWRMMLVCHAATGDIGLTAESLCYELLGEPGAGGESDFRACTQAEALAECGHRPVSRIKPKPLQIPAEQINCGHAVRPHCHIWFTPTESLG